MSSGGSAPSMPTSYSLILTGFMGTGKSSAGRAIAQRLGGEFVDMDSLLEAREGRSIPEIFQEDGEAYFRRLEAGLCRELAARPETQPRASHDRRQGAVGPLVIATGGGALIPDDNLEILSASGAIVCLTASPDEIVHRLESSGDRPLMEVSDRGERVAELLAERSRAYGRIPLQLDTSRLTVDQVVDRVLALAGTPAARRSTTSAVA